jgi:hypothetical protein
MLYQRHLTCDIYAMETTLDTSEDRQPVGVLKKKKNKQNGIKEATKNEI